MFATLHHPRLTRLLAILCLLVPLIVISVFAQVGVVEAACPPECAVPDNVTNPTPGSVNLDNPLLVDSVEGLFRAILAVVLVFAVPIIVFFIVYAGFLYVTARGNEQTITQANRALLYALIGGLLILGAYVFIEIISNLIESVRE